MKRDYALYRLFKNIEMSFWKYSRLVFNHCFTDKFIFFILDVCYAVISYG